MSRDHAPGKLLRRKGRLTAMLGGRVNKRAAVLAGPATHIPGVFYLIALNVIASRHLRVSGGTVAVMTYNAIWFALPILALIMCILHPAAAQDALGRVDRWARRHSRTILLCVSFFVGTALVVRGALAL